MRKVLFLKVEKNGEKLLESAVKSPEMVVGSLGFVDDETTITLFIKEIDVEEK